MPFCSVLSAVGDTAPNLGSESHDFMAQRCMGLEHSIAAEWYFFAALHTYPQLEQKTFTLALQ